MENNNNNNLSEQELKEVAGGLIYIDEEHPVQIYVCPLCGYQTPDYIAMDAHSQQRCEIWY